MTIGKLSFGKRANGKKDFKWFYSPLLECTMEREGLRFFYWFGHNWYVCCRK